MLMMDVPSPTTQGESVELICSYELDEDKLYSVKWYKDDVEFYRYVPNDWPPGQFLPLQGVKVDIWTKGSPVRRFVTRVAIKLFKFLLKEQYGDEVVSRQQFYDEEASAKTLLQRKRACSNFLSFPLTAHKDISPQAIRGLKFSSLQPK
ncbi:ig-like domain-containing protein [Caerostris extrusa]|uniref:Ig-like domain-containing protein n=1 Tax=Caerostris extrusa TaxID=172846 RepID=A0AAV4MNX5_CAEEX|nr:ig-like domain-containing protein [Caerostris extrusa]